MSVDDDEVDLGADPEREEWDSGPFCRHWGEPGECEILCVCGHPCRKHYGFNPEPCDVDGCECKEYRDAKDPWPQDR